VHDPDLGIIEARFTNEEPVSQDKKPPRFGKAQTVNSRDALRQLGGCPPAAANSGQIRVDARERIVDVGAESLKNEDRNHGDQGENQRILDKALTGLFFE
jgi:hypothetical protein